MNRKKVLDFLKLHHDSFLAAEPYAKETGHPAPSDSRSWSQILVTFITGIKGLARKKGPDFYDGSDVKAANLWSAIDTPRFNGVTKSGTKSKKSDKLESLDDMPYLFFVLWDTEPIKNRKRCRIWVVRPQKDKKFRELCNNWYSQKKNGSVTSSNFQLQPPRNKDSNIFTTSFGYLSYPLLMSAVWEKKKYKIIEYRPEVLTNGKCKAVKN